MQSFNEEIKIGLYFQLLLAQCIVSRNEYHHAMLFLSTRKVNNYMQLEELYRKQDTPRCNCD